MSKLAKTNQAFYAYAILPLLYYTETKKIMINDFMPNNFSVNVRGKKITKCIFKHCVINDYTNQHLDNTFKHICMYLNTHHNLPSHLILNIRKQSEQIYIHTK